MKYFIYLTLFLLLNLNAQEEKLDLKVFGTIGAVYNDNSEYTFTKGPHSNDGSSKDIDPFIDSVLGIHGTYKFDDSFSFLNQIIINRNDFGDKKPNINSAYLKYDTNENTIFKIGRIRLPYYKNSDNNHIGYSKLMIREANETYSQMPLYTYNGIEFIYSDIINKYFYSIQGNYGEESFDIPIQTLNETFKNELKELKALNITFGNNIAEARLTYLNGKISTNSSSLQKLFSTLRQNGFVDLANKYELKNKKAEYFGFGLFIDYQNFIFKSEYGKRTVNSFFIDTHGFYTTLGYRINSFVPYISYAKVSMLKNTSINTVSSDLNYLVKIQNVAQSSNTIGVKYNINQNLDLKFEYQRIKPKGDYGGFNLNAVDPYSNSNLNVYSFVLDFVF